MTAFSAITSLMLCVVYITPFTTSGVTSLFSSDRDWKTHLSVRSFAFAVVICVSGLCRWLVVGTGVHQPVLRFCRGFNSRSGVTLGAANGGRCGATAASAAALSGNHNSRMTVSNNADRTRIARLIMANPFVLMTVARHLSRTGRSVAMPIPTSPAAVSNRNRPCPRMSATTVLRRVLETMPMHSALAAMVQSVV